MQVPRAASWPADRRPLKSRCEAARWPTQVFQDWSRAGVEAERPQDPDGAHHKRRITQGIKRREAFAGQLNQRNTKCKVTWRSESGLLQSSWHDDCSQHPPRPRRLVRHLSYPQKRVFGRYVLLDVSTKWDKGEATAPYEGISCSGNTGTSLSPATNHPSYRSSQAQSTAQLWNFGAYERRPPALPNATGGAAAGAANFGDAGCPRYLRAWLCRHSGCSCRYGCHTCCSLRGQGVRCACQCARRYTSPTCLHT